MSPFCRKFHRRPAVADGPSKSSQSGVQTSKASLTFTAITRSIYFLALLYSSTPCWAQAVSELRRPLDAAITDAQSLESPLLAPKAFDEAKRLYEAADAALRKDVPPADARAEVETSIPPSPQRPTGSCRRRRLAPKRGTVWEPAASSSK
jgi:hypothetical protein